MRISFRVISPALPALALLASWSFLSAAASHGKVLAIGVDYADMIYHGYLGGYLYNAEKIHDLMRMLKEGGMDEVYWRVSAVGLVTYPSRVMTVMDGARLTDRGFSPAGVIMRQCDPLAVAIEEAHKQGLKLFVYITLFDFSYPGLENDFFAKHPEYWSRLAGVMADNLKTNLPGSKELADFSSTVSTGGYSKLLTQAEADGTTPYIRGVPSYGYPEVRQYVLSQVKELIAYRPDGIYFDVSRTHSGIYPVLAYGWYPQWTSPYLKYGYNEPEVALYKKRYGKNPPLRGITSLRSLEDNQDDKNWNAVRGHFLTEFLREASGLIHAASMKVAVEFYPDTYNYFQPGTHTRQQLGRMNIDWKTWSNEKLIDIIRLNVDHRKHGYDDWVDHSADTYRYAQERGVKVYVDCAISGTFDMLKHAPAPLPVSASKQPDLYYGIITEVTRNILHSSADGVFYYEAGEKNDALYGAIRKGAGR